MNRATANLPSRDLDMTEAFYAAFGFSTGFKDDGWMIMHRGELELEFFPHAELVPRTSCFSACLRVDDLDAPHAAFSKADLPTDCWSIPRMDEPQLMPFGLRMFHVIDLDGSLLRCIDSGEYLLPTVRHENLAQQQPLPPTFRGRVWVLIDGGTFSTAAEFCAVARSLGRATFVGEETGGAYEGNASGTFAILTLPNTGVRAVIPLVRYELAVVPPVERGRGVLPDYRLEGAPSLDDRVLISQVLALISRERSRQGPRSNH